MAVANIYRVVQDLEGNVVTGVLGTVTLTGTSTLAALFSDSAGTLALPNPTTNNAQYGSFNLFLAAGTYDMQFVKSGYTFETQRNIVLRDPAAGVNTITGTANRVIVAPVPGVGAVTLSTPQDIAPDSSVQFAHIGVGTPATSAPIAYADQPAARAALGLGTMAQQNAASVAITGGTLIGNVAIATTGQIQAQNRSGNDQIAYHSQVNSAGGTNRWALLCQGDAPSMLSGHVALAPPATLRLGASTPTPEYGSRAEIYPTSTIVGLHFHPDSDANPYACAFRSAANVLIGSIQTTNVATTYNTTSDARLKHHVAPLTGALDLVRALRPVAHRWRADDSPGVGFLAHEVAEIVDGVVTGEKDAVDAEGNIQPMQIDYSKLVPWLTAALREVIIRLEAVEAVCTQP